jgi:rare lipoprotein A
MVRINDRGPFAKDRVIDLSKRAAERIGLVRSGVGAVRLRAVSRADASGRCGAQAAGTDLRRGASAAR